MAEATMLAQETAYFEQHKSDYLKSFPGLFVLIKGEEMRGPFATAESAYEEGLRTYGMEPFLVKQVVEEEPIGYVPIFFSSYRSDARL